MLGRYWNIYWHAWSKINARINTNPTLTTGCSLKNMNIRKPITPQANGLTCVNFFEHTILMIMNGDVAAVRYLERSVRQSCWVLEPSGCLQLFPRNVSFSLQTCRHSTQIEPCFLHIYVCFSVLAKARHILVSCQLCTLFWRASWVQETFRDRLAHTVVCFAF